MFLHELAFSRGVGGCTPLLWGLSKQLPSCLRHFREERNAYLKEAEFHVKTRHRPSCEGPAREGKHPFKYLVCIQNPLRQRPGTHHSLLTCLRNNADVSGVPERKPRLLGTPEPEAPVRPRIRSAKFSRSQSYPSWCFRCSVAGASSVTAK